jgi:hypothetical protein
MRGRPILPVFHRQLNTTSCSMAMEHHTGGLRSVHIEACLLTQVGWILLTTISRGSTSSKNITAAARGPTSGGKLAVRKWQRRAQKSIHIPSYLRFRSLLSLLRYWSIGRRIVCSSCFVLDILLVFSGAAILYSFTTSLLLWLQPPTPCTPLAISHDGGVGVLHIISFVLWRLQGSLATCRVLGGRLYHLFLILVDFAKEETRQEGIKSAICFVLLCVFHFYSPYR